MHIKPADAGRQSWVRICPDIDPSIPMRHHSIHLYHVPLLRRSSDSAMDIFRNPNANDASITDWKNCAARSTTQCEGGIA